MLKVIKFFPLLLLLLIGCEAANEPGEEIPERNGFATVQVANIFAKNCARSGCHAGSNPQNGLSLETQALLMKGSTKRPNGGSNYGGDVVIPFNSEKSLLYRFINGDIAPRMPFNNSPLLNADISAIKNWIDGGAKNDLGEVPSSNPSYRVYVCNQASDRISVIDGDLNVVSRLTNVDLTVNTDSPHMVKEFGDYYYITLISAGKFLKIRKSDNQIVDEVGNLVIPGMIQIHHSGTKAYVSRSSSGTGDFTGIYVIDIENMALLSEINLIIGGVPHGMVLHPENNKELLYVANLTKNQIHIINTITDLQDDVLPLGVNHEPMQLSISPDGAHLYISARATAKFLIWDTNTKQILSEVVVNPMPMHIAVSSSGQKIYVSSLGASVVEVIDKISENAYQRTNQISHPAFSMLHGCDLTGDDRYLYVSSRNLSGSFIPAYLPTGSTEKIATVGIIDTQTESVIKVIEIEEYGAGLVVEK